MVPIRFVDTHCHLNLPPLCDDRGGVLDRAAAAGVTQVVVPAYDLASWGPVAALARGHEKVFAALGVHPWLAHEEDATGLADAVAAHRPVALGEIGLDTKITTSGLDQQLPLLDTQLALAADLDLPVILHCRGAFEELLAAVQNLGGRLRGVLHAYSRGPELADRFIAAGLHIALGGTVTRDRARRVRKTAARLPWDRLLLETDAPSIGLDGVLPEDTEPRHVADVAREVAEIRGETLAVVAERTTANARALFDLPE